MHGSCIDGFIDLFTFENPFMNRPPKYQPPKSQRSSKTDRSHAPEEQKGDPNLGSDKQSYQSGSAYSNPNQQGEYLFTSNTELYGQMPSEMIPPEDYSDDQYP